MQQDNSFVDKMSWCKFKLFVGCLLAVFMCLESGGCLAQTKTRRGVEENKDSIMPFKTRVAVKTNAVDWLFLMPNLTAEFDLFGSPYKHYTLSFGVKGNWKTTQNYTPKIIYNLFDSRLELRKYFRTTQRNFHRLDSASFMQRLKDEVFTFKRFRPRYWRAYYWGVYADYADFNYKFGSIGKQGSAVGFGLSGGFSVPLYGYRNNFVDLELGASVGVVAAKYDAYRHDEESNCYPHVPEKSKGFHFVPYPVVSELRVAFVYRFGSSVRNKYKLIDYEKIYARQEAKQKRKYRRDSINHAHAELKKIQRMRRDSLESAKDSLQGIQDSLKLLQKDSLRHARKLEKEQLKLRKDSLQQVGGAVGGTFSQAADTIPDKDRVKEERKRRKEAEKKLKKEEKERLKQEKKRAREEADRQKKDGGKKKRPRKDKDEPSEEAPVAHLLFVPGSSGCPAGWHQAPAGKQLIGKRMNVKDLNTKRRYVC